MTSQSTSQSAEQETKEDRITALKAKAAKAQTAKAQAAKKARAQTGETSTSAESKTGKVQSKEDRIAALKAKAAKAQVAKKKPADAPAASQSQTSTLQAVLDDWELRPLIALALLSWPLSWILWNWREAVMDLSGYITPVQPFLAMAEAVPFFGSAQFISVAFALLAIFAVYVLQFSSWKNKQQANTLRYLTHFVAAMITFRVFWDIWHWLHLNSEWFHEMTFFTGKAAITFLFLSLACTPLITLFGWSALTQLKKPLGNWGFGFVLLHLLLYSIDNGVVSNQFVLGRVIEETFQKQYALIGFAAFVLLIPLFVTSNKWSQKKLGRSWKRLHQLVYLIGILGSAHYIWVWWSKRALMEPIVYAIVLVLLLVMRIPVVKNWIRDARKDYKQLSEALAA